MGKNKKFLLVITGETFRCGPQGSRDRGGEKSFSLQKKASESHIDFIKKIKIKYGFDCDVFFNIYSLNEQSDDVFLKHYDELTKLVNINKELIGEQGLNNQTLHIIKSQLKYDEYDFLLFIRADTYLKNYFFNIFDIENQKITFAHVNEIEDPLGKSWNKTGNGFPAVNHQILYIPKKFYSDLLDFKIWANHYSYELCMRHGISKDNIGFFIYTHHSSSTDVTWNPIFHQVGRNETKFWVDKKYIVDNITHETIITDNEQIYDNLTNNDFNDIYDA